MFIPKLVKKMLLMMGLSSFLMSCATTPSSLSHSDLPKGETNTQIGVRYLLGRGVIQNDDKAFYYFAKAAEGGDPFAQNELAYLYAAGRGTPQNFNNAFILYQKAANHQLASAQYNLGLFYLQGIGTPQNISLGKEWLQKSAQHGFEPAKVALAEGNI